jgi:hypothetical protein
MGKKELLIKEIDQVPEPFLDEILGLYSIS